MSLSPLETRTLKAPEVRAVDVDKVDEDPNNARLTFDAAELKILGESLKERQLYPIQVRRLKNGRFLLLDGARRLRAAKLAGLKQLRAEDWGELSDQDAAMAAATANLEREDLTPYEEARAYKRLVDLKVQKKEICETFGIPFNTLQGRLELLELPEAVAKRIGDARGSDGTVFGLGHAKALQPLAKQPKLLEAALAGFDKQLPEIRQAHNTIIQVLQNQGLIADPQDTFGWNWAGNHKTTAAAVKKLDSVKLVEYGNEKAFVVDVAGFKAIVAEHQAREKAADAKERSTAAKEKATAKVDPVAAKRAKDREALDAKARDLGRRTAGVLQAKALGEHLAKSAELRGKVLWNLIRHELEMDRMSDQGPATVAALAQALKLDHAAAAATFTDKGSDDEDDTGMTYNLPEVPPTWFAKAKLEQQAAFAAAFACFEDLTSSYSGPKNKAFFGANPNDLAAQAVKQAREQLQADAKKRELEAKAKATANLKLAHEDKKKPGKGGGAPPASSKKATPAPKANGKAKAKAPAKVTPAVAKARATLSKTKQAVLAASPAPAKPLEAPSPAASPRELADKVLADVLPGLKAVKQAAADNGIQA
ncbi:MAG: ParB/RepB/Spo0J family partition protein [Candidatus Thermoplasmatota archaeon]|jgi:ParB family chromosome partitioning protein